MSREEEGQGASRESATGSSRRKSRPVRWHLNNPEIKPLRELTIDSLAHRSQETTGRMAEQPEGAGTSAHAVSASPVENIHLADPMERISVNPQAEPNVVPIAGPSSGRNPHQGHDLRFDGNKMRLGSSWPISTIFTHFEAMEGADGTIRYRCSCTEEIPAKHPAELYLHLYVLHRSRSEAVLKADEALGYPSLSRILDSFKSAPRQRRPAQVIHVGTFAAESALWKSAENLDVDDVAGIRHVRCLKCRQDYFAEAVEDVKIHLRFCDPIWLSELEGEDERGVRSTRWNLRTSAPSSRRASNTREGSVEVIPRQRRRREQTPEGSRFGQYCTNEGCERLIARHDVEKCTFCLKMEKDQPCIECEKPAKLTQDLKRLCPGCDKKRNMRIDCWFAPGDWTTQSHYLREFNIEEYPSPPKLTESESESEDENPPTTPQPLDQKIKREPMSPEVSLTLSTPQSQQTPRRRRPKREQSSPRVMQPMHLSLQPVFRQLSPRDDTEAEDDDSAAVSRSSTPKTSRKPSASRRSLHNTMEDDVMDITPQPSTSAAGTVNLTDSPAPSTSKRPTDTTSSPPQRVTSARVSAILEAIESAEPRLTQRGTPAGSETASTSSADASTSRPIPTPSKMPRRATDILYAIRDRWLYPEKYQQNKSPEPEQKNPE